MRINPALVTTFALLVSLLFLGCKRSPPVTVPAARSATQPTTQPAKIDDAYFTGTGPNGPNSRQEVIANGSYLKQTGPVASNPKRSIISFRVDDDVADALEKKRERMGVLSFSISDTVREMMLRQLKDEGLL